jgi:hypothetical protein
VIHDHVDHAASLDHTALVFHKRIGIYASLKKDESQTRQRNELDMTIFCRQNRHPLPLRVRGCKFRSWSCAIDRRTTGYKFHVLQRKHSGRSRSVIHLESNNEKKEDKIWKEWCCNARKMGHEKLTSLHVPPNEENVLQVRQILCFWHDVSTYWQNPSLLSSLHARYVMQVS